MTKTINFKRFEHKITNEDLNNGFVKLVYQDPKKMRIDLRQFGYMTPDKGCFYAGVSKKWITRLYVEEKYNTVEFFLGGFCQFNGTLVYVKSDGYFDAGATKGLSK